MILNSPHDNEHPVLKKTLKIIAECSSISESKYKSGVFVHVYHISDLTIEDYSGGYRVMYKGEKLFSTHTSSSFKLESTPTDLIYRAIKNKLEELKNKAVDDFLKL